MECAVCNRQIEPEPRYFTVEGKPRHMLCEESDILVPIDSLGSVRTKDGRFEAICWTHRGSGWDVHSTKDASNGAGARTKQEAYALLRKIASGGA